MLAGGAFGDVELVQDMERLDHRVLPVFDGSTDWLNATARTKREGGVKSPGIPSMPEP